MISRLGWKADVSEDNSDCSVDSLTDADEAELDDFFSFLSMEGVTTGDSLSNVESDCFSDNCASSDYSDDNSIVAPPFSPIPSAENELSLDAENPEGNQQEPTTEILEPCSGDGTSADGRVWNGFKLVGDNIDKNYHQSFNRMDKKTSSIHYFHYYAVCDRIDLSTCSEAPPSAPIDVEKLIVDMDDLAMLHSDVIILMSRLLYV